MTLSPGRAGIKWAVPTGDGPIPGGRGRMTMGGVRNREHPRDRAKTGSMNRNQRAWLALAGTTVTLGMAAWLVVSVGEMHDRIAATSPGLAVGFVIVASVLAAATAGASARLLWKLGRPEPGPAVPPEDVVAAADVQAEKAEGIVGQVRDQSAQARLRKDLAELRLDRQARRFHVVVFGTGSAGKTSLLNALLGRVVGRAEATIGTTKAGEAFTNEIEDVEGPALLTDTPAPPGLHPHMGWLFRPRADAAPARHECAGPAPSPLPRHDGRVGGS